MQKNAACSVARDLQLPQQRHHLRAISRPMNSTFSRLLLLVAGAVFTVLGFVGIVIPILPGILFFAIAAACFVAASPALKKRLRAQRHFRGYFERYEATEGLSTWDRSKLAVLLSVDAGSKWVQRRFKR